MGEESKCKMTGSTDDCIVRVNTESGNDELIWMLGSSYQDLMTTTGSHRASKDTTKNTCNYYHPTYTPLQHKPGGEKYIKM